LIVAGLRWKRQGNHGAYIRISVRLLAALGIAWGILVNLFALGAKPDQQGILVGLVMALVSTPMLAVPLSAALAFYIPISLLCSIAIVTQPLQVAAVSSFFGFLGFALIGLFYMNMAMLERSIGRLNLQREHKTVSLFLREFETVSSDWLWETDQDGRFRNVSARMATVFQADKASLENLSIGDISGCSVSKEDGFDNLIRAMRNRMPSRISR